MAGNDNIKLQVLTPTDTLFEGNVSKVELPGDKGRFMVMRNHAPVISSLSEGDVVYMSAGDEVRIRIQIVMVVMEKMFMYQFHQELQFGMQKLANLSANLQQKAKTIHINF